MTSYLLDVNVLLAIADSGHEAHATCRKWLASRPSSSRLATCPLTENAFVRILSSPAYPAIDFRPYQCSRLLNELKRAWGAVHQWWPGDVSIADEAVFDLSVLTGNKQISDAYLLGLAHHHGGRVASLDRGLPWRVVRGAKAGLVELVH